MKGDICPNGPTDAYLPDAVRVNTRWGRRGEGGEFRVCGCVRERAYQQTTLDAGVREISEGNVRSEEKRYREGPPRPRKRGKYRLGRDLRDERDLGSLLRGEC